MSLLLTARWFAINPKALNHRVQKQIVSDLYSNRIKNLCIAAGRRSFKTERFLKRYMVSESQNNSNEFNYLGAPTRIQAKKIFWKDIKELSHPMLVKKISNSDLTIEYINGTILQVVGLQEFKRVQGTMAHRAGITEYQECDPDVYSESFEPMLNDTDGLWIEEGRPFGKNHFYDDYLKGVNNEKGWASYHWKASDILTEEQILRAKSNLALKDYEREYNASFETEFGAPYYSYSKLNNKTANLSPDNEIIIVCDFNATEKPMSWVIGQRQLDNYKGITYFHKVIASQFTNTEQQCETTIEYLDKAFPDKRRSLVLTFYGDYAGKKETSNSSWSDWEIIENKFRNQVKKIEKKIKPCKSVRNSIAATNAQLCNTLGIRSLFVNYEGCKELVLDWEKCVWKSNNRELEDKDPLRGHASRAVDYYNDYEFPVINKPTINQGRYM
jgi:hypothetical protein